MDTDQRQSFLARHEFLIRRLHSLSGLIPVGAFMVVHLTVNASVLNGPATFQKMVNQIHSLGALLPLVEWVFIFIPILFHGVFGFVIIRGGLPNSGAYPYANNIRYSLQRASGMLAFLFIIVHVFHMHGWFHWDWWLENVAHRLNGHVFRPYSASSTAGAALGGSILYRIFYLIGVAACVYHLANGIWTMGITWGAWATPAAQRRANYVCAAIGLALMAIGLGGLKGLSMDEEQIQEARQIEDKIYKAAVEAGTLEPNPHKRWSPSDAAHEEVEQTLEVGAVSAPGSDQVGDRGAAQIQ